ncbi:MAG TPA: aromatic acid exporter family protein [Actinomycetes bacterium]|nr:aromatic acid exporter family protein [Actinomycetes bacterium]
MAHLDRNPVALLRRPYLRLAVLSAAAASAAYGLGVVLPHVSAVVAAVTALISVRPTFHASMKEALRQVLAVVLGAGLALAAMELVGYSALALFATILVCYAAARVLRLGEEGALAVSVTVILVVGPHFSSDAVEARFFGVLLGSALALVTSYFTRPGTPDGRALADLVTQSERAATLMSAVAETLDSSDGKVAPALARRWLLDAEDILSCVVATRQAAVDAAEGARWSPMIDRERALAVVRQARMTERTAVTLVSMCRDLDVAAARGEPLHDGLAMSLSDVLLATAEAIGQQSEKALSHPAEPLSEATGPIPVARRARTEAAAHVRHLDDTTPLLLGGSLLRDAEKITEALSGQ